MKTLTGLAALAVAIASAPLAAQTANPPMSAEDLVIMPRLGSPAISGDGNWVVYSITHTAPQSYERKATLYLKSLADVGAAAIPLALDDASEASFGADGMLYFLSGRAGTGPVGITQVWRTTVSPDGSVGDIQQVTSFKASVAGFRLSPDGQKLAVWGDIARDCPSFGCDSDGNTSLPGPGTGRLYDSSVGFVRHWDAWETPGNYSRALVFGLSEGKATGQGVALDGPAGEGALVGDTPTKPFGDGSEIVWSRDSASVYFVARKSDANEPRSTNLDIYRSDLAGGVPVNLTEGNLATDTQPTISPDGKWLAYAAMERPGYEADRLVVHLRDLQTGETRAITQQWDRSVSSLAWTPDSRWIIATAQDVLDTPAFRIDPATGKVEKLDLVAGNEAHIGGLVPLASGGVLFSRDSIDNPAELYLAKDWTDAVQITNAATSVIDAKMPVTTQRFSFKGANGDTVWGQITKLDGLSRSMPAILYVHGGPQGSFNDSWSSRWNPRVVASQGYAVISVDFHGSTGYGQAFTDAIRNDWGGKPLEDLQKGLEAALKLDPQIDGANACAMGASYGGYMMNWIAGKWPDRFKCLVQHDGVFDARAMAYETEELWFDTWEHGGKTYFEDPEAYEIWNPVNHVDQWRTPMLVITGEKDFRIPYTQGLASFTALQMKGVPSQLLVFPDENHWVLKPKNSLQWHETVFTWLERWLGQ